MALQAILTAAAVKLLVCRSVMLKPHPCTSNYLGRPLSKAKKCTDITRWAFAHFDFVLPSVFKVLEKGTVCKTQSGNCPGRFCTFLRVQFGDRISYGDNKMSTIRLLKKSLDCRRKSADSKKRRGRSRKKRRHHQNCKTT